MSINREVRRRRERRGEKTRNGEKSGKKGRGDKWGGQGARRKALKKKLSDVT